METPTILSPEKEAIALRDRAAPCLALIAAPFPEDQEYHQVINWHPSDRRWLLPPGHVVLKWYPCAMLEIALPWMPG